MTVIKDFRVISFLMILALTGSTPISAGIIVTVPGDSNPWLAGMSNGSTASFGDSAPSQSPILVAGLDPSLTPVITISSVSGQTSNSGLQPLRGPDGGGFAVHSVGAENGISGVTAPLSGLLGVFLDGSQPDLTSAPVALDFSSIGLDFVSLSPELKQVFFIGDGLTSTGTMQSFIAPSGATRLFLGTMDGGEWSNNPGSLTVELNASASAVPEPSTFAMLASGGLLAVAPLYRRRLRPSKTGKGSPRG